MRAPRSSRAATAGERIEGLARGARYALAACLLALAASLPSQALEAGDPAPSLQGPLRDGTTLALDSLRGQVVYVDFWASWCAPCAQALPALDGLYRKYRERGFSVVAVNVDTEREPALAMIERIDPAYPVVFDPQGSWPERFALRAMPSGYLLDRDGVIRHVKAGYQAKDLPQLETLILRQLEEQR